MNVEADATSENVRCPKCGRQVESLQCGHCGSQLPSEQADLYGAVVRQLAKMGGNRADAGHQGGGPDEATPSGWVSPGRKQGDEESAASEEKTTCTITLPRLTEEERHRREGCMSLMHGDAVTMLKRIPDGIGDLFLFDPLYPHIKRPYGTITEEEWHDLMKSVLRECKRILKPHGSVVVILQSNYERVGRMRLWPWKFVCWAAQMWDDWGLIEDVYSFAPNPLPSAGVQRPHGLLRKSIKWCVWLGPADCHRNQDAVLMEPSECMMKQRRTDDQHPKYLGGATVRREQFEQIVRERGGVTPHNLLIVPTGTPIDHHGHPAVTPYRLAEWWCQYALPPSGVLIDPFCGSGTTLLAALDCGASKVIGIDKEEPYLELARQRISGKEADPAVKTSRPSGFPTAAESSRRNGQRRKPVWPSAPGPFARDRVERWKRDKLTATEESMRRFFGDKSWLVGGPIPLVLLYGSDSMSLVRETESTSGLRQAGNLLGQKALGQLTDQMKMRDIDEKYHGGLVLLYLRLCRRPPIPSEQAGLAL